MDLTQTDSHTPCVNSWRDKIKGLDDNMHCIVEALANKEEFFVIRAQDVSAPAIIKFWIKAQHRLQASLDAGLSLDMAVKALESYYFLDADYRDLLTPKQAKALAIAEGMEKFEGRRLAD